MLGWNIIRERFSEIAWPEVLRSVIIFVVFFFSVNVLFRLNEILLLLLNCLSIIFLLLYYKSLLFCNARMRYKKVTIHHTICRYIVEIIPGSLGYVGRVLAYGLGNLGSIPGCVIPKTLKMVLDTYLINTQQYKVRIKGKVEQSGERSSTLPYTWCSSYWKGSLVVALDSGRQFYFYSESKLCTLLYYF